MISFQVGHSMSVRTCRPTSAIHVSVTTAGRSRTSRRMRFKNKACSPREEPHRSASRPARVSAGHTRCPSCRRRCRVEPKPLPAPPARQSRAMCVGQSRLTPFPPSHPRDRCVFTKFLAASAPRTSNLASASNLSVSPRSWSNELTYNNSLSNDSGRWAANISAR